MTGAAIVHDLVLFDGLMEAMPGIDRELRARRMFGCPAAFVAGRLAFCVHENSVGVKIPEARDEISPTAWRGITGRGPAGGDLRQRAAVLHRDGAGSRFQTTPSVHRIVVRSFDSAPSLLKHAIESAASNRPRKRPPSSFMQSAASPLISMPGSTSVMRQP